MPRRAPRSAVTTTALPALTALVVVGGLAGCGAEALPHVPVASAVTAARATDAGPRVIHFEDEVIVTGGVPVPVGLEGAPARVTPRSLVPTPASPPDDPTIVRGVPRPRADDHR